MALSMARSRPVGPLRRPQQNNLLRRLIIDGHQMVVVFADRYVLPISICRRLPPSRQRYTMTSANDSSERDPYSWTLSGSNDGVDFTLIDTRTAQDFTSRFQTRLYEFSNNATYEYYRFDFLTEYGATGHNQPNSIQLAEIELLSSGSVNYGDLIDVDLASQWAAHQTSVYQRIAFDAPDASSLASLTLDLQYDDGFVAYLNGVRVASALRALVTQL